MGPVYETAAVGVVKVGAVVASLGIVAASALPDANVLLNVITVILLIVFGPRYIRTSRLRTEIQELKDLIDTSELQKTSLKEELIGVQARADKAEVAQQHLKQENAEWKARYDEQTKYTAPVALEEIKKLLEGQQEFHKQVVSDNRTLLQLVGAERHEA